MRNRGRDAARALATLVCATLAACGTRPDYQPPRVDPPAAFRGAGAEPAVLRSFGELGWWEVYDDAPLAALIRRGLERNRDVRIAAARIAEARANLGVAEYGPLPTLSAGVSYARSRVSQVAPAALPAGVGPDRRNWRATIDASYEVDFWGRLDSLAQAAKADFFTAEFAAETVAATLVGDIATGYFDLLSLDQQLAISLRTIDTRRRFLDLTQARLRGGAATKLDVDRAQANLSLVESNVPDLRRRIAQAENLLQFLTGAYPALVERARPTVEALPNPPVVPVGLPSTLLERRPDIRQAEQAIIGNNARLASQRAALLPTVSLTAQLGSDARSFADFLTVPSRIWSIGPSILLPILNAQRNRFQVDVAAAREVQSIEQYQKVVEQSLREVADALVARLEFGSQRDALAVQVTALRDAERIATRRYEAGVASYFDVIDAQRDLFGAELAMAQAQRNVLTSSVQLYKALGGGWQIEPGAK